MKTILVLTDFSDNAMHAANTALMLGQNLRANLLLYNTYVRYQTIESYAAGSWLVEEFTEQRKHSIENLCRITENLNALNNSLGPHDFKPAINWQSGDEDLQQAVFDIIKHGNIELVVMGARSDKHEDFLFGEDTKSILDHAKCPVLIIPGEVDMSQINKVIFASNFGETDMNVVWRLVTFSHQLKYEFEIVHVNQRDSKKTDDEHRAFIQKISRLKYPVTYTEIEGDEVADSLKQFCKKSGPGLLAMIHRHHSFLVRLFTHSQTKSVLSDQRLPLLIFPENG